MCGPVYGSYCTLMLKLCANSFFVIPRTHTFFLPLSYPIKIEFGVGTPDVSYPVSFSPTVIYWVLYGVFFLLLLVFRSFFHLTVRCCHKRERVWEYITINFFPFLLQFLFFSSSQITLTFIRHCVWESEHKRAIQIRLRIFFDSSFMFSIVIGLCLFGENFESFICRLMESENCWKALKGNRVTHTMHPAAKHIKFFFVYLPNCFFRCRI